MIRLEQPTTVHQAPPTTALSGMGAGGGMCIDPTDKSLYITDRTPAGDRLQRISPDAKTTTVWTWPDKPGVAGCAALDGTVLVNLVNTKQTVAVRLAQGTGAVTGEPEVVRQDTARPRLGAAGVARTETSGAQRSTAPPATPRSSTTWSSRSSRRAAASRAATPTTPNIAGRVPASA